MNIRINMKRKEFVERDEKITYLTQWVACSMCFFTHVSLLFMFFFCSVKPMFYYNIGSVTFYTLLLFYLGECPKDKREYATEAAAIEVLLHQLLCMFYLGVSSGFQQFLIPTAAYMFLYSATSKKIYRTDIIIASICIITYAIACFGLQNVTPLYVLPAGIENVVYTVISGASFAILIAVVGVLSYLRNEGYREINEKNLELQRLAKTKSDFLASMSHEIRTPLNVVIGMTELTLKEEVSDQARENLEYICSSGKNLLTIINDILDLSKMESNKMKIVEGDYAPWHMLHEVITLMEIKAKEKQLPLNLDIQQGLPETLWGDETRLRQVLINLIGNAIKFTQKGHVTLKVTYIIEEDDCNVTFSVEDTGVGIKQEGLSISNKLVSLMGGNLKVDSIYDVGSTFYFIVKQKIFHEKRDNLHRESLKHFMTKEVKVLVVDDSWVNLKVSVGYLSLFGMQIDQAENGFEAVEKVKQNVYDLIFMDHMMPERDGVETMQEIRKLDGEYYEKVPIIALTANVVEENQVMLLEKGFQDIVSKPIEADVLAKVIRKWISNHKIMKET
ncbi:MAG TPA: response regulator [Lachnospiraceae bacterium]|nr:response regulator [Lachnospiraceae bacterium]